jgi:flavin reductase (DIM6/NTAB) family NADH-FMN oxidoreductase RutF
MSDSSIDPVLGRVPSGIFILTATDESNSTGMLASWVMQAGFEPPMVTVAVKQGRYVETWLATGNPFVLNVVGHDDKTLLKHFGRGFEPGVPAFEGLETELSPQQVPVLKGAIGHLECKVTGQVASGDHTIFLAEVLGGAMHSEEKPMVHVRKSGKNY